MSSRNIAAQFHMITLINPNISEMPKYKYKNI